MPSTWLCAYEHTACVDQECVTFTVSTEGQITFDIEDIHLRDGNEQGRDD